MPVTITLQKIKDKRPCKEGWDLVFASRGENPDYDREFPLTDIITSNCLNHAIWALRCVDPIYARLFALECAKMVRHLMKDERSINAIDVTERFLSEMATREELIEARRNADAAAYDAAADTAYADTAYAAADAAAAAARKEMQAKQEAVLRSILGNMPVEAAQ